MTQNRMSAAADKRAELDLQISLSAEHEVIKLAALLSAVAERLGIQTEGTLSEDEARRLFAELCGRGDRLAQRIW
jgi:uncharacterized membrane protein